MEPRYEAAWIEPEKMPRAAAVQKRKYGRPTRQFQDQLNLSRSAELTEMPPSHSTAPV
jgi:hypothetical protein